ncbi:MAG TPA: hypothetical protein GXZ24_06670 [Firmicutes bacterium]|nr:hypothetical protein [Bacillota bacterium]
MKKIEVSEKTLLALEALLKEGDDMDKLINRLVMAARASGLFHQKK